MQRTAIPLEAVAERKNLVSAFAKAARGKRHRQNVQAFIREFDRNINGIGRDIVHAALPYGRFRCFRIFDPKERLIHAACFEDRIFHHALMNLAGPVLERAMTPFSYACRPGMGVHRAAKRVQHHCRQYPWYTRIDIAGYFASIGHECLLRVLQRKFKGQECISQLQRIVACYETAPQQGLPIGSLTSQYFANYFLDGLDRLLANLPMVQAQVRYMDDVIWWCDSRQQARETLAMVRDWLGQERGLKVKDNVQIHKSRQGVTWCGFRILQGAIRLSRRRKRRFQQRRRYWEQLYLEGVIDEIGLQRAYASVEAITAGTDSRAWRRENFARHPPLSV